MAKISPMICQILLYIIIRIIVLLHHGKSHHRQRIQTIIWKGAMRAFGSHPWLSFDVVWCWSIIMKKCDLNVCRKIGRTYANLVCFMYIGSPKKRWRAGRVAMIHDPQPQRKTQNPQIITSSLCSISIPAFLFYSTPFNSHTPFYYFL